MPRILSMLLLVVALAVPLSSTSAASPPTGFVDYLVARGLSSPTAMALAPDGRIFVSEQRGTLRVIRYGKLLSAPFFDIRSIVDFEGERGLLGVAIDPDYTHNHYVYVYYTRKGTHTRAVHNEISRFTASSSNPSVSVPGSQKVIFRINALSAATNHNGGALHFGTDGKLYVSVGDNAYGWNSQHLTNLKGKILRINRDGSIPTDNPFYSQASGRNRAIWALGFRNPFTFDVQPGTGVIYINDVGQDTWEEIDRLVKGANYGWPIYEGPDHGDSRYRDPIYYYGHGSTTSTGCAITGGAFYNPKSPQFPSSYVGRYFYSDLCGGWIRLFNPSTRTSSLFETGVQGPVDLRVSSDGTLYYLAHNEGAVHRVVYK